MFKARIKTTARIVEPMADMFSKDDFLFLEVFLKKKSLEGAQQHYLGQFGHKNIEYRQS